MSHRARKRFGQNFLQNPHVIDQILTAFHPQKSDKVVEIGPGMGALTKPLLSHLNKLIAIEIDRDLEGFLRSRFNCPQLEILVADALTIDFSRWGSNLRIIGNLPYNISTPILLHLLDYSSSIEDMHFMLQKEVVERLAAKPGTKDYGRLTVMVQYYCEVESLFEVPPEAFNPKPKVDSAVVRLTPHKTPIYSSVNRFALEQLVAKAFAMRRKTLANNLKPLISAESLSNLGIDPSQRPEQISIKDYVNLTHFLNSADDENHR